MIDLATDVDTQGDIINARSGPLAAVRGHVQHTAGRVGVLLDVAMRTAAGSQEQADGGRWLRDAEEGLRPIAAQVQSRQGRNDFILAIRIVIVGLSCLRAFEDDLGRNGVLTR